MSIFNQLKSVISWEDPKAYEIFRRFTDKGDEIKNASKLILQPGQGCMLTYEGKVVGVFDEEGIYDIQSDNKPFITSIKKYLKLHHGSEHIVGIWFFRKAEIANVRWGTRIPIKYNDPVYGFPVHLRGFGNYSMLITDPQSFFTNIVAGQEEYFCVDLQELLLSRVTQPISNFLANAKFSYADIDSNMERIARDAHEKTGSVFTDLGFKLLDFRIEGTSFDEETNKRIDEISDVQADVKASQIAGVDFAELQKLKAMRDAAKNEGAAGAGMGMITGVNLGQSTDAPKRREDKPNIREKLKELKELFEDELISEDEYKTKKQDLIDKL
jgi:membrane protease subunit (stomatin/prohibitin family)